jgi:hypothetical protein
MLALVLGSELVEASVEIPVQELVEELVGVQGVK